MNEIQIIQSQLATERAHFAEVANLCAAALGQRKWVPDSDFAQACVEYFAFAVKRLPAAATPPGAGASQDHWHEFLTAFNESTANRFAAIERLPSTLPVTEWRAHAGIDADSIFTERARYARVKATVP